MSSYVNRWQWLETLASECGPTCATTRHVLQAFSIHMNPQGKSAFPTIKTIAIRTALSERAVTKHVSLARSSGWIEVTPKLQPGRGWRVNCYRAMVPDHVADNVPEVKEHTERRSVRSARHTERGSVRSTRHTEPNDATYGTSFHNIPNQVPTNKPINKPVNNKPPGAREGAGGNRSYEQGFPPPGARSVIDELMLAELKKHDSNGEQK